MSGKWVAAVTKEGNKKCFACKKKFETHEKLMEHLMKDPLCMLALAITKGGPGRIK